MSNPVQKHYQCYPYPHYPLLASVRRCDTYAHNLLALWTRFNSSLPPPEAKNILIAGCGTFSPYPFSVANPDCTITALDISKRSLDRARLHCLLHGRINVNFRCVEDPLEGLKTLEKHLMPGGIIRIMMYSRYARRDEESIRHALRILGIKTPAAARKLLKKARPGSRLADYLSVADEAGTDSGIADALLHPCVKTYRIDELLDMIARTGLKPLLFAHADARENVYEEIDRLRLLENERTSPGNFILYLGAADTHVPKASKDSLLVINPCLRSVINHFTLGAIRIPPRTGHENPPLGHRERRFLRLFLKPVSRNTLHSDLNEMVEIYKRRLFLLEYLP
jgi:SAM-dependent methyltransferase